MEIPWFQSAPTSYGWHHGWSPTEAPAPPAMECTASTTSWKYPTLKLSWPSPCTRCGTRTAGISQTMVYYVFHFKRNNHLGFNHIWRYKNRVLKIESYRYIYIILYYIILYYIILYIYKLICSWICILRSLLMARSHGTPGNVQKTDLMDGVPRSNHHLSMIMTTFLEFYGHLYHDHHSINHLSIQPI